MLQLRRILSKHCFGINRSLSVSSVPESLKIAELNEHLVSADIVWNGTLDQVKPLIIFEDNHLLIMYKPPTILMQGDMEKSDNLLDACKRYLKLVMR